MGHRLKEAIHQRYRLENAREQTDARLRQLELDPDMAHGGRRHASHEIESLHTRREQGAKAYAKNLTELEQMLSDLARDWPQTGLTQHQMTALENVFVNTPEFRYRLAEKIGHQENCAWLLRRNIENMKDWLGAGDGMPEALGKYFIPNDQQFVAMAPWAAKSLIALYADDKRGIGKRTSDIAFGISQAVVNLCTQPFAAARQPVAWQSAIPRSAYTTLFALTVVAGALHAYRDRVMVLNSLAIEHAFLLLRLDNPGPHASLILDKLASAAVIHMKYLPSPDDARREWAAAVAMPAFPRALALWSSANLIDGDATLACSLFRRAGELPLSRYARDRQLSRMLSLLDLAVATGTECKRPDLVGRVIDLWDEIYPKWRPLSDRWNDAARMLVAAVAGDGQERAAFVSDPAFARSHCRQMIDGVGNALPPP